MTDEHAELLDSLETIEKLFTLMGEHERELNALKEENARLREALKKAGADHKVEAGEPAAPAEPMNPGDLKLLLVDDSKMDRRMTTGLLASMGIENITQAETGKEALALVENVEFDIVLLDYEMSDGNGMWFLTSCKEMGIKVPIMMLSGALDKKIVWECLKAKAVDFLVKPINKEFLASRLEKALHVKFSN